MSKCNHSFRTVGVNANSDGWVWWCKKCGVVERGGKKVTLVPLSAPKPSLLERIRQYFKE